MPRRCTDVRRLWVQLPLLQHPLRQPPHCRSLVLTPRRRSQSISSLPSQSIVALPTISDFLPPLSFSSPPTVSLSRLHFATPPSTFRPSHNSVRDGWRDFKSILSNFVAGSKQLYHNAKRSRSIKQRLRANPSLILDRSDHRHLKRTRVDLMGGALIVVLFWVPFVGNVIPLLAHFFPRQLPSVFVTLERQFDLIRQDVEEGLPILLELQQRIDTLQPPFHAQTADTSQPTAAQDNFPPSALTASTAGRFVLSGVTRPVELLEHRELFERLPLSQFSGLHLQRLLHHHANLLVAHSLLPASVLMRHLHDWAASIQHDDGLLLKEGRGQSLTVRELSEALHERGLYKALMSPEYAAYIAARLRRKREGTKTKDEDISAVEAELEAPAKALLLSNLDEWLQLSEESARAKQTLSASLLCHAGPITMSDYHLALSRSFQIERSALSCLCLVLADCTELPQHGMHSRHAHLEVVSPPLHLRTGGKSIELLLLVCCCPLQNEPQSVPVHARIRLHHQLHRLVVHLHNSLWPSRLFELDERATGCGLLLLQQPPQVVDAPPVEPVVVDADAVIQLVYLMHPARRNKDHLPLLLHRHPHLGQLHVLHPLPAGGVQQGLRPLAAVVQQLLRLGGLHHEPEFPAYYVG